MHEERWQHAPPEVQHTTLARAYQCADSDTDEAELNRDVHTLCHATNRLKQKMDQNPEGIEPREICGILNDLNDMKEKAKS